VQFFAGLRWENGQAACPRCESKRVSFLTTRLIWKCLDCKKQFSIKVGTTFEDSPIGLDKWFCAMFLIANCKDGVSSYEIARDIHVTQKSAWLMLQRIRHAMHAGTFNKLSGQVEADETFIGGKARNICTKTSAPKRSLDAGRKTRQSLWACWSAAGDVRVKVDPSRRKDDIQAFKRTLESMY
jgi:transposase-like protein